MKYTLAVDFDGVLHSYTSGYHGIDVIRDPPVPGAIEWLNRIVGKFKVVIFTTRAAYGGGARCLEWLRANGYSGPDLQVTATKPPALAYLDDRAIRFEGTFPTAREIHKARPWHVEMEGKCGGESAKREERFKDSLAEDSSAVAKEGGQASVKD